MACFTAGYVAADDDRNQSSAQFLLPCDKLHIRGLAHDIDGNHRCRNTRDLKESIRFPMRLLLCMNYDGLDRRKDLLHIIVRSRDYVVLLQARQVFLLRLRQSLQLP